MSYYLGLVGLGGHDAAAAIVDGRGRLLAAAEEERYTRIKFDPSFPSGAIAGCLKKAGIDAGEVSRVGYYFQPNLYWGAKIRFALKHPSYLGDYVKKALKFRKFASIQDVIRDRMGYAGPIDLISHHLCHGASVFYGSPFDRATIVSIDGAGEWETCWIGLGEGLQVKKIESRTWPHSLGEFYAAITQFLGYKYNSDEYKVMGLAPYGEPAFYEEFKKLLPIDRDGLFSIDTSAFDFPFGSPRLYNRRRFEALFGPANEAFISASQRDRDFAASAQKRLEDCFIAYVQRAISLTGVRDVCLTGGVAMNCSAIGKLLQTGTVDRVFLTPASADPGCAIGAAYEMARKNAPEFGRHALGSPYLGDSFSSDDIASALQRHGLTFRNVQGKISHETARLLAAGKVVGWFQNGTEFGQRALGARSILGNPTSAEMRDVINAKVKHREMYRPFAPSVLKEAAPRYFDCCGNESPYMTHVFAAKPEQKGTIPAVVHVDNTSRVQTVTREANGVYYDMIEEFGRLAGPPLVLNTSFNVNGEPIVNTPEQAIRCYLNTDIDALAIGAYVVEK